MKFRRCPRTYLTENMDFWLKCYRLFKNGMLNNGGGWLQNPNKYIEVMLYVDDLIASEKKES